MATLTVAMETKRVLYGTQVKRLQKGIEHLYYLVLFSSNSTYRAEAWRTWLRQGLTMNVRSAPPDAREVDRYMESVSYGSRSLDIKATADNKNTLTKVTAILKEIEGLRHSLAGKAEEERAKALLENKLIASTLVGPVTDALKRNSLHPEEGVAFAELMRRALVFLTDDDLTAANWSLN